MSLRTTQIDLRSAQIDGDELCARFELRKPRICRTIRSGRCHMNYPIIFESLPRDGYDSEKEF
jgi:hypothetical protein